MTYYKFLQEGRVGPHSGAQWAEVGKWMPEVKRLEECVSGYHVCRKEDLPLWIDTELYEIELAGRSAVYNDKVSATKARLVRRVDTWSERTRRMFACDSAEHVLHIFEDAFPDDSRPRETIEAARRYARGEVAYKELAAARAAAWAAAARAAWAAARAAAGAAGAAARAAWAAAGDAAWAAAWAARDAARAAGDAAWVAERAWQSQRLMDYIEGRTG